MYTAVNGIYENGKLSFTETPPTTKKSKVVVMFLEEIDTPLTSGVRLGSLTNLGYALPDDFNEPLDDLKDYML